MSVKLISLFAMTVLKYKRRNNTGGTGLWQQKEISLCSDMKGMWKAVWQPLLLISEEEEKCLSAFRVLSGYQTLCVAYSCSLKKKNLNHYQTVVGETKPLGPAWSVAVFPGDFPVLKCIFSSAAHSFCRVWVSVWFYKYVLLRVYINDGSDVWHCYPLITCKIMDILFPNISLFCWENSIICQCINALQMSAPHDEIKI